jgi:hypothetical protein
MKSNHPNNPLVPATQLKRHATPLVLVALLGIALSACSRDRANNANLAQQTTAVNEGESSALQAKGKQYQCPMHPNVTSDKPGKCSICGMNLIEASHSHHDSSLAMKETTNSAICSPESACPSRD